MSHSSRCCARCARATPLLLLALVAGGCDRASASAETTKAESGKASSSTSGEIVLETVELPGVGKLALPKGYTSTMDKHWRFDLGGDRSIHVSWEPHGAATLEKAKSMSNILATAETIKSATTLPSGYHEIERVRASDGFTFIVVFGPDWYVKCVAPASDLATCREIVRSKA